MGTQSTWENGPDCPSFFRSESVQDRRTFPNFARPSTVTTANMKIWKDIFSGDEMFSDTYRMSLVQGVVWEVIGKWETRTSDEIQLEGANASAEEAAEGTESSSQTGIDIVLNHRLTETSFGAKKDFLVYLKTYMKNVAAKLEEQGKGDQVDEFKKNIQPYVSELMKSFKDLMFFVGESMDPDAMIVIAIEKEVDIGGEKQERPVMMFFKHGLEEEKF